MLTDIMLTNINVFPSVLEREPPNQDCESCELDDKEAYIKYVRNKRGKEGQYYVHTLWMAPVIHCK